MLNLNKITADIRNIATSGANNYDFRIEDELIQFWIHEVRSMLISQAITKKEALTDQWIQSITCLPLIQVDASECCLIESECKILRSQVKIPNTVEYYNDNLIIRVIKPNGEVISKTNAFEAIYNRFNKYTYNKSNWFIKNGYIYITNDDTLQYINLYGIFEDPMELTDFINCENEQCITTDTPYPVSLKMANEITNIIIQTKVNPLFSTKHDISNDGSDKSGIVGKPDSNV